jgi:hypothetical protein
MSETTESEDFRNRPAALRKVASTVAALVAAGGYEDLFGYDITAYLTNAQAERLDWAIDEVKRRLWNMGEARR